MGFLKEQQLKLAIRLLSWQYTKSGHQLPEKALLDQQARRLVDDAQRIARERGGNVLGILKEMVSGTLRR